MPENNHVAFHGLPTDAVRALQRGGTDANGQPPERATSDGDGTPCRHCLTMIEEGEAMLVLAHRPFETVQPYAEIGPVFLHARECEPYDGAADALPPVLEDSPDYIVRGYDRQERIVYGTGGVVARESVVERAADVLTREDVAFVHIRSSRNNCWQARAERE